MFQPIAPNFLRSWTIAWKKENPNSNFLYISGFVQSSKSLTSIASYVLRIFYLKPLGGSKVIFTEFCRVETGKSLLGILVSHNLKSLWLLSSKFSTIYSSFGINDVAKWQFMRRTHPPLVAASIIIFSAFLSWPLPSEILSSFFDIFISSANLWKSATGSDPGLRTKMSGIVTDESLKLFARLKVGGSINSLPSFSTIKFYTARVILSGLILLRTIIFCKVFSFLFHSPGIGWLWGSGWSNIFWKASLFLIKKLSKPLNIGNFDIANSYL